MNYCEWANGTYSDNVDEDQEAWGMFQGCMMGATSNAADVLTAKCSQPNYD